MKRPLIDTMHKKSATVVSCTGPLFPHDNKKVKTKKTFNDKKKCWRQRKILASKSSINAVGEVVQETSEFI